ncbi:HutD family protein [Luteimonas sp. S4-F44]|uniref:HutD/Ves family protein n=1 Tax=Luteimonas sp. S4-F44 TaxID=2925842 RepID=UPI001F536192|nr:HutD family protein [Luteimonas sp. S4-F44]UNK41717.1 HutD family protein [Luteimonas sp. S4-F44]
MPNPATVRIIPAATARSVRWRNGHGWTRELFCAPALPAAPSVDAAAAAPWPWRISIARIDRDAPFSAFPGVDRELMLLRGGRLDLQVADRRIALASRYARHRFAGERDVAACVPTGGVEVFNLMWRRDVHRARLWHLPLAGALAWRADPATTWVVHLLAGHARCGSGVAHVALAAGDTAVLSDASASGRVSIEGEGALLAVCLHDRLDAGPDDACAPAGPDPMPGIRS